MVQKPHKPLSRQVSSSPKTELESSDTTLLNGIDKLSEETLEEACALSLENKQIPSHIKLADGRELARPFPKALARVSGKNTSPVCPPTPTHHARRLKNTDGLKPPSLKAEGSDRDIAGSPEIKTADIRNLGSLEGMANGNGPSTSGGDEVDAMDNPHPLLKKPDVRFNPYKENPRLSLRALTELHVEQRGAEEGGRPTGELLDGEASGGLPLALRHIASSRLPSIPKRTRTHCVVNYTDSEEPEEPLPPCKCLLL